MSLAKSVPLSSCVVTAGGTVFKASSTAAAVVQRRKCRMSKCVPCPFSKRHIYLRINTAVNGENVQCVSVQAAAAAAAVYFSLNSMIRAVITQVAYANNFSTAAAAAATHNLGSSVLITWLIECSHSDWRGDLPRTLSSLFVSLKQTTLGTEGKQQQKKD